MWVRKQVRPSRILVVLYCWWHLWQLPMSPWKDFLACILGVHGKQPVHPQGVGGDEKKKAAGSSKQPRPVLVRKTGSPDAGAALLVRPPCRAFAVLYSPWLQQVLRPFRVAVPDGGVRWPHSSTRSDGSATICLGLLAFPQVCPHSQTRSIKRSIKGPLPISDCGESFSRKVGGVYVPRYLLPNCVECPAPGYIRLPSHARCTAVCTPTSMPGIEFISRTAMQRYACLNSYDQGQAG
jgi:hypothetical protein